MAKIKHVSIAKAALEVAKLSLHLVPEGEDQLSLALEVAEKGLQEGKVPIQALQSAAKAAHAVKGVTTPVSNAIVSVVANANVAITASAYDIYDLFDHVARAAHYAADAHAYAVAKYGTRAWYLERVRVLKQCLAIVEKTFSA